EIGQPGLRPGLWFARSDAVAFRRAALYGKRHAGPRRHVGWLAQPAAGRPARPAWAGPGAVLRAADGAHSVRAAAGRQYRPGTGRRKAADGGSPGRLAGFRPAL